MNFQYGNQMYQNVPQSTSTLMVMISKIIKKKRAMGMTSSLMRMILEVHSALHILSMMTGLMKKSMRIAKGMLPKGKDFA